MRTTRSLRLVLGLLALLVAGLVLSGCAFFKAGSLKLTQPAEIGSVHVQFELCTTKDGEPDEPCDVNEGDGEGQQFLGFAVPVGASAPAAVTATPITAGAQPMVFVRNDQVGAALAGEVKGSPGNPWPPPGTQVVGYITDVIVETTSPLYEWSVGADFGIPPAADGGSSGAPYSVKIASGWRGVDSDSGLPASRPLNCKEFPDPPESQLNKCTLNEGLSLGVSDLLLKPPTTATAFPGGTVSLAFGLDFASSAPTVPSFNLSPSTSLPGAQVSMADRSFTPGPVNAAYRSPAATRQISLTIPKGARPGGYEVVLNASTAGGGAVGSVATLKVVKPTVKLVGKPKLNKKAGTAVLTVKVPGAGALTASGKGIVTAKKSAKAAKKLKLMIRAKGAAKRALTATGKAKVSVKLKFKPQSGAAGARSTSLTLKLG